MPRRALPPEDFQQAQIRKSIVSSEAVSDGGKAPPARRAARQYPGQRVKVPPVETKPNGKVKQPKTKADGEAPVQKPLPHPNGPESQDAFISRCMSELSDEFGDQAQRAAVCHAQWSKTKKADGETETDKAEDAGVNKADNNIWIGLPVPEALARALAIEGGEEASDLHLTLCFSPSDYPMSTQPGASVGAGFDGLKTALDNYTRELYPIRAQISGIGRFVASDSSDGKDVFYVSVDSSDLTRFRQSILKMLEDCGFYNSRDHGFTPHITLAYIDTDAALPFDRAVPHEFMFDTLHLMQGKARYTYGLGVSKADVTKAVYAPIIKTTDQRLVTGIILKPEVVDAQGDVISKEAIAEAAHKFVANYNRETELGLQHKGFPPGLAMVESWIAPVDLSIGGKPVPEGAWVMTAYVENDSIWAKVKAGGLTGFSIGGVAKVQRLGLGQA